MKQEINLAICIPSTEMLHADFMISVAGLLQELFQRPLSENMRYGIINIRGSIIQDSRDRLCKMALEQEATHILFLDSDMSFPPDTLHRLFAHNLPIVACNYVKRVIPATSNSADMANRELYTYEDSTGLQKALHAGFGVTLIDTKVFKEIPWPWFDCVWMNDGSMIGEDVFFYKKAADNGFNLMVDHDASQQICHMGQFDYMNNLATITGHEPRIEVVK